MKKLAVIFGCLFTSVALGSTESQEFVATGLKALHLKNSSGNVKISTSSSNGKAYVEIEKVKFEKNCTLKMDKTDDALTVEVDKVGLFSNNDCKIHFNIKVPKEVALHLKMGSGDLNVKGTKGTIDFILGSGDAKIDAEIQSLDATTGSGSIEAMGIYGNANIKSGSGNVRLLYKTAPPQALVNIMTGSGDATIYLPSTTQISTDFKAGSGQLSNELTNSTDAPFKILMKAGSGSLQIKKL